MPVLLIFHDFAVPPGSLGKGPGVRALADGSWESARRRAPHSGEQDNFSVLCTSYSAFSPLPPSPLLLPLRRIGVLCLPLSSPYHAYLRRRLRSSQKMAAVSPAACVAGLTRFPHHTDQINRSVPLLRRSSAGRNRLAGHCLCQAVAHFGEKCGLRHRNSGDLARS